MEAIAISQTDIERIDAVWGNPDTWVTEGLQWGHLQAIQDMINRHVTGDPSQSSLEWFFARVAEERSLPLDRVLVLACGSLNGYERMVIRSGWAREVVAVDISPGALKHAEAVTREQGIGGIRYEIDDMNALTTAGPFDAVLGIAALHHCADLENLYDAINRILTPDGWLFLDDFIGPSRFQWTDAQILQVNRLLQILPDRFVRTKTGLIRRCFDRLSAQEIADFDPSEAVRSDEIVPLLKARLRVEEYRSYGGLLHLVLATIAQNFEPDLSGDATGPAYLQLLIDAADQLRDSGRAIDEFAVAIARPAIS